MEILQIWHGNSLSKRDGRAGHHFPPQNTKITIFYQNYSSFSEFHQKYGILGVLGVGIDPFAASAFGQAITVPN